MSNNTAGHVGREITKEIAGQPWTFSRWDRQVWVDFAAWAKQFLPDPIDAAMRSMDKIALKDAEVIRELTIKDQAEQARAAKENRLPVLMAPKYTPMSNHLSEKALDKAASYLAFNSAEMNSLINSAPGSAYLVYLLLRPKQPEVTESQAFDLMQQMSPKDIGEVFETTSGRSAGTPKNA